MPTRTVLLFLAALTVKIPALASAAVPAEKPAKMHSVCGAGLYQAADRSWMALYGGDSRDSLAYESSDREVGHLKSVGGAFAQEPPRAPFTVRFQGCEPAAIEIQRGRITSRARRVDFPSTSVRFHSGPVELAGTLVMPPSGRAESIVVWVTGSDQTADIDHVSLQYILPLRGIGVFVFDKRGTGSSGGEHTANFHLRAADAAVAVEEVRRLVGPKSRIGLFGVSQGGWVAPLAASKSSADFVIVGYGLAEGVPAEDRDEIVQNLEAAGFGAKEIEQAMELQAAATKVVVSHWQSGWDDFEQVRNRYRDASWVRVLGSDGYTAFMTKMSIDDLKRLGPQLDQGVSFEYDPLPTIRSLTVPQLWILGTADTSTPSIRTQQILSQLQLTGLNLDLVVFPKANHGIIESEVRNRVRHVKTSRGYWDLLAHWALKQELPPLPDAKIQQHGELIRLDR